MAKDDQTVVKRSASSQESTPVWNLHQDIDDLFEDFYTGGAFGPLRRRRSSGWPGRGAGHAALMGMPDMDVIDKQDETKLFADLPGMDESDIEIQVTGGMLMLSGEKGEETEEGDKEHDYYLSERSFGSFKRAVRIPDGIGQDKTEANFRNGMLTDLPKKPEAQVSTRRIEVKTQK